MKGRHQTWRLLSKRHSDKHSRGFFLPRCSLIFASFSLATALPSQPPLCFFLPTWFRNFLFCPFYKGNSSPLFWVFLILSFLHTYIFKSQVHSVLKSQLHSLSKIFPLNCNELLFFKISLLILERQRHQFVVTLLYAFIGWLLYVPWPRIEPTTLVYRNDVPTNWATWPVPAICFFKLLKDLSLSMTMHLKWHILNTWLKI